jgi:UPF0271 protein
MRIPEAEGDPLSDREPLRLVEMSTGDFSHAKQRRSGKIGDSQMTKKPQEKGEKKDGRTDAYVLDTSALLLGFTAPGAKLYTTSSAVGEVKHGELQVARLDALLRSGTLAVATPSKDSIEKARRESELLEEFVSRTDLEILAAALDLAQSHASVTIVTDDHALQNIAAHLGLGYKGLKHPEIRKPKKRRQSRRTM